MFYSRVGDGGLSVTCIWWLHCDNKLSTEGSLVITRAYQPYTLVGPPVWGLVLDPLAVYSLRTVCICYVVFVYFIAKSILYYRNSHLHVICQVLICHIMTRKDFCNVFFIRKRTDLTSWVRFYHSVISVFLPECFSLLLV